MLLAIGTTTVDLFISGLDQIPSVGGDEFTTSNLAFLDEPLTMVLGGNGANTAYVAARLGLPTRLCSALGADALGDTAKGWLASAGVRLEALVQSDRGATPYTTVITDQALNRLAFHHRGVSATFSASDLPAGMLDQAAVVLISGYPLLPAWRDGGAAQTLRQAKQAGALTAFDIGPAIGQPVVLAELVEFLPHIDYFLCNEHELTVCTEITDAEASMAAILEAGVKSIIIKRGADGAWIREADFVKSLAVPGFPIEARFTVGAGDSFNAGFLYGILQAWDLHQSTVFANATAACVVSSRQGVLGSPARADVQTFLETAHD